MAVKNSYPSPDTLRYKLEQPVWFKLDREKEGIVTGILFRPSGVCYKVTWEDMDEIDHFECELTASPEEAKKAL